MDFLYLLLILLGCLPLFIILKRIHSYRTLKNHGVLTDATVSHIHTQRTYRGLPYDRLTLVYTRLATGKPAVGQVGTVHNKYKVGDRVSIAYKPNKPEIIIPQDVGGFAPALGFALILFLFVLFATYKIREMVVEGY
jgi:hypothetical protein